MATTKKTKTRTPKRAIPKSTVSGQTKTKPRTKRTSARGKGKLIGKVSHYFDKIGVAAIKLTGSLKKGDSIKIEGGQTLFSQKVVSLQKERENITAAKKDEEVGIQVKQKAREGYRVYKV